MLQQKTWWIAAAGAALGLSAASFYLMGGDDLYRYYLPFAQGCLNCGYVPYFAQWFLWPLRLFPEYPFAWPVWVIFTVLGFLALAYFSGVNPFLLLISFPMLGQIWLGQIDVFICLGLIIFVSGKNPYLRGLGIALAMIKPQLTFLPVLLTLLLESPRTWLKLLTVPALLMLISFFVYGLNWPVLWVKNAMSNLPVHVWRLASMDVWRLGIFLLPVPLLIQKPKTRLLAGLLVSALATPFYGVYSYIVFLLFDVQGWTAALSYAWLFGLFYWKETAMRFAWILPLAMLIRLLYVEWREKQVSHLLPEKKQPQ